MVTIYNNSFQPDQRSCILQSKLSILVKRQLTSFTYLTNEFSGIVICLFCCSLRNASERDNQPGALVAEQIDYDEAAKCDSDIVLDVVHDMLDIVTGVCDQVCYILS